MTYIMIYLHGFVPDDFGKGITIPVLKDKLGDVSSVDNYRLWKLSNGSKFKGYIS